MPSAGVRFKDRHPLSHRWLRAANLLASLAALASTLAMLSTSGFPDHAEGWLWAGLLTLLPAVGIGGLAFLALPRIRGRAAAWCCGISGIAASGFWTYACRDLMQSGDPGIGLAVALLPIALLPFWAVMIVAVVALEWWSTRTPHATA